MPVARAAPSVSAPGLMTSTTAVQPQHLGCPTSPPATREVEGPAGWHRLPGLTLVPGIVSGTRQQTAYDRCCWYCRRAWDTHPQITSSMIFDGNTWWRSSSFIEEMGGPVGGVPAGQSALRFLDRIRTAPTMTTHAYFYSIAMSWDQPKRPAVSTPGQFQAMRFRGFRIISWLIGAIFINRLAELARDVCTPSA